jgi:hypothetical protein
MAPKSLVRKDLAVGQGRWNGSIRSLWWRPGPHEGPFGTRVLGLGVLGSRHGNGIAEVGISQAQLHPEVVLVGGDRAPVARPALRRPDAAQVQVPSTLAGVRRVGAPSHLMHLQRLAGNRAVVGLMEGRPQELPGAEPAASGLLIPRSVQRCGSIPPANCGCRAPRAGALQREEGASPATVQRVDYSATHTCGLSESARVFSSWAVAVAKLTENIPSLAASFAAGVATPNLKSNLLRHFKVAKNDKTERSRVLGKLVRGYSSILLRMGPGLAKVRCGGSSCEHDDYAYTRSNSGNSTIWLCNVEFTNKPILDLAATWIHELSHSLFDTDDNGYYTYTGSAQVADTNACLNEADCWGNFMVSYT